MVQAFRIQAITVMVPAVIDIFRHRYEKIMQGKYHGELVVDEKSETKSLVESCKAILRETLYRNDEILRLEVRGRTVIHDLMKLFWEAASSFDGCHTTRTYPGKAYLLMSENYRRQFEDD